MIKRLAACAILSTALTTAALAAGPGAMDSTKNAGATHGMNSSSDQSTQAATGSSQTTQTAQNLPQEIRHKLQNNGFTDIKVVPRTFAVSAKDRDGDPVLMMIGPHSMTMISAIENDNSSSTTGSASSSSGSGSSSSSK